MIILFIFFASLSLVSLYLAYVMGDLGKKQIKIQAQIIQLLEEKCKVLEEINTINNEEIQELKEKIQVISDIPKTLNDFNTLIEKIGGLNDTGI